MKLVSFGESSQSTAYDNFSDLLFRLRGHRDQITAVHFLSNSNKLPSTSTASIPSHLLTSSKDTFLKLWDLTTQHCIQTIVAHRAEIWTMDIDPQQNLVFTGSGEGEVKVWKVDHEALTEGLRETETGEVIVCTQHTCCDTYIPYIFTGRQNDPLCRRPSSFFSPPYLSDIFPPFAALPRCAIPRQICRDLQDSDGGGGTKEERQTQETHEEERERRSQKR